MKTLFLSLLALASSTSAYAMLDMNCVDSQGRILAIQPFHGKQAIDLVVNGKETILDNVSEAMPELNEAQGYLAGNKTGASAHVIVDQGPVIGDARWTGKAWGQLLTADGRIIQLDQFFCKNN